MGRFDTVPALPERALAPPAGVLYSAPAQTITANGDTGPINVSEFSVAHLVVYVAGVTGTTPTLNVYWDHQDAHGNWIVALVALAQLTSAPNYTHAVVGATGGYPLPIHGRARWVVGGTSPSWTGVTISLIGR